MTQLPEEKQDGCSGLFVPLKIVFHALRQLLKGLCLIVKHNDNSKTEKASTRQGEKQGYGLRL